MYDTVQSRWYWKNRIYSFADISAIKIRTNTHSFLSLYSLKIEACLFYPMSPCKGRTKRPCDFLKFIDNSSLAVWTTFIVSMVLVSSQARKKIFPNRPWWWKNTHRNQVQEISFHVKTNIVKPRFFTICLDNKKIRVFAEKVLPKEV